MRNYIGSIQNKLWYQASFAVLAFLSAGMFLYEIFDKHLAREVIQNMDIFDFMIAWVFLVDFLLGVLLAPKKLRHIKTNWLDLVSAIPFSEGVFRAMRILRFTRLMRLIRAGNSSLNVQGGIVRLYRHQNPKK